MPLGQGLRHLIGVAFAAGLGRLVGMAQMAGVALLMLRRFPRVYRRDFGTMTRHTGWPPLRLAMHGVATRAFRVIASAWRLSGVASCADQLRSPRLSMALVALQAIVVMGAEIRRAVTVFANIGIRRELMRHVARSASLVCRRSSGRRCVDLLGVAGDATGRSKWCGMGRVTRRADFVLR